MRWDRIIITGCILIWILCRSICGNTRGSPISGQEITLRPVRSKMRLVREDGIGVFSSDEPFPQNLVQETMEEVRPERDEQIFGKVKLFFDTSVTTTTAQKGDIGVDLKFDFHGVAVAALLIPVFFAKRIRHNDRKAALQLGAPAGSKLRRA